MVKAHVIARTGGVPRIAGPAPGEVAGGIAQDHLGGWAGGLAPVSLFDLLVEGAVADGLLVVARRGGLRAQRAMSGQRNHEKPVCGFNLAPKKEKKEDICGSPLTRNFLWED